MSDELAPQFKAPRWPGDERPDFAQGNGLAVKHGAHSRKLRAPLERELIEWAQHSYPWLAEPRSAPALAAWARAEAIIMMIDAYVGDEPFDEDDKVRSAVSQ